MTPTRALLPLLCCLLLVAGCEQSSIAEQERVSSLATLEASTPSATPTPLPSATPTPPPTATPTVGPTATPTLTPPPTATPLPPTPTPNPALANFSLCTQAVGDTGSGRFSAQITAITTTAELAFDRVTIGLRLPGDSAAPYAVARCLASDTTAPDPLALHIELDGWLHDDLFRASPLSATLDLSGTTALKSLGFRYDPQAAAGATLVAGLDAPRPFRLQYLPAPPRLVLEVAKTSAVSAASDPLAQPVAGDARPPAPIFYLQDGDIWKYADSQKTNLTNSPEAETALAVRLDAGRIAFCRAEPGTDIGDALATSTLWLADADGGNQQQLAAEGRTCAEPTFSPDGKTVAFTVNEGTAAPPRLSIYRVPVSGGAARRLTSATDEWSRFAPQWIDNNRLVYSATAEDGRNTLFILSSDGRESDIGAALVVGDRYRALGRPLVAVDGSAIAVEGLRASAPGADLLLLDGNGAEKDVIGAGYWSRPLAWNNDNTLFYLTAACASEALQEYTLYAKPVVGNPQLLAAGSTAGAFGEARAVGNGLVYVALAQAAAGPRGPLAIAPSSASALWYWDVAAGPRARLAEAQSPIGGLAP